MKKLPFFLIVFALYGGTCNSAIHNIFVKKSPREIYLDHIGSDPRSQQWIEAAENALSQPASIQLPYGQHGYFPVTSPHSLGLEFKAKQGERLVFKLNKQEGSNFVIYADLFWKDEDNPSYILSADTLSTEIVYDVPVTGTYILRLQPELDRTGEYDLAISQNPSLGFPVSGKKANIGSLWGDSRDGGKRRHEGIDIFAPKHTPVVAAADGYVTGVKNGGIGGKTVWLRLADQEVTLYYAHLDKQLVRDGQFVKKGEVIGLVGNTGNARYTPAHLHFGVYTWGGPVDPFPFVNPVVKQPPVVKIRKITGPIKLAKNQRTKEGELVTANTVLTPLAITSNGYLAQSPDGKIIESSFNAVE